MTEGRTVQEAATRAIELIHEDESVEEFHPGDAAYAAIIERVSERFWVASEELDEEVCERMMRSRGAI